MAIGFTFAPHVQEVCCCLAWRQLLMVDEGAVSAESRRMRAAAPAAAGARLPVVLICSEVTNSELKS